MFEDSSDVTDSQKYLKPSPTADAQTQANVDLQNSVAGSVWQVICAMQLCFSLRTDG